MPAERSVDPEPERVVALTGTPGTGKSTIAQRLEGMGLRVLDLKRYVGDPRFDLGGDDERSGTTVLDEAALDAHLSVHLLDEVGKGEGPVVIDSHFAHNLQIVDRIIVLRCRPSVLKERLKQRGYTEKKVRENLEVEGMDLILQESLTMRDEQNAQGHTVDVGELDNTQLDPEKAAQAVYEMTTTASANLDIGRVDWSDEVLGWY